MTCYVRLLRVYSTFKLRVSELGCTFVVRRMKSVCEIFESPACLLFHNSHGRMQVISVVHFGELAMGEPYDSNLTFARIPKVESRFAKEFKI